MNIDTETKINPEENELQKNTIEETETTNTPDQPTIDNVLKKIEKEKPNQIPIEIMLYHLLPADVKFYLSAEAKDAIDNYKKENVADISAAESYTEDFYSKVADHKIEMKKIGYGEILNKIEEWTKNITLTEKTLKIIENEKPKLIEAQNMPIEYFYYALLPDEMKSSLSLNAKKVIENHLESNSLFRLVSEEKAKELLSQQDKQSIGMNMNVYKKMIEKIEKMASEIKE